MKPFRWRASARGSCDRALESPQRVARAAPSRRSRCRGGAASRVPLGRRARQRTAHALRLLRRSHPARITAGSGARESVRLRRGRNRAAAVHERRQYLQAAGPRTKPSARNAARAGRSQRRAAGRTAASGSDDPLHLVHGGLRTCGRRRWPICIGAAATPSSLSATVRPPWSSRRRRP